ncbi:f68d1f83-cc69-4dd8-8825-731ba64ffd23 [Thermothielavioides terrestris]|uniref:F68d1f83-cc69-4dd8-8825-731ba64ffd23 n=1 Tax=Thermothielavioides terrestris TaxID=2587410 RepID=A0A3S4EWK8_9PEZI|nr:f68d1f83-cc69-4dd8-8825-731ba64ffd23 [Thermothielavioides terrestris]
MGKRSQFAVSLPEGCWFNNTSDTWVRGPLPSARAELFVAGRELANMYEEENDSFEQRRKFVEQLRAKEGRDGDVSSSEAAAGGVVDESYVYALASGLPPTGRPLARSSLSPRRTLRVNQTGDQSA